VVYTVLGKIWLMEDKFEEGEVMDGVDGSSFTQGDQEVSKMEVSGDDKSRNF
jgi:hypothetical protein